MMYNEDQIAKAREAKSAEELLALAKENGMEMTEEEAADLYQRLHESTELTDEELEDVSGGCGSATKVDGVSYRKIPNPLGTSCMTGQHSYSASAPFYLGEVCLTCTHYVETSSKDHSGYCNVPY